MSVSARRPALALAALATCVAACSAPSPSRTAGAPHGPSVFAPALVVVPVGTSLQHSVDSHPPGTTFVLASGVHRESVRLADGDSLVGQPHAVLSGARRLTAFTRSGSTWWVGGQTQHAASYGTCGSNPLCGDPDDVVWDGKPLLQVKSLRAVTRGTFYRDRRNARIYVGANPSGHDVEASVLTTGITGSSGITVKNLTVQGFAVPAQQAAVDVGSAATLGSLTVRLNHGRGVDVGDRTTLTGSRIDDNGQLGVGGGGTGSVVSGNDISDNNYAGFDAGWEAGGSKFAGSKDLVVRDNTVRNNAGPGLWADVYNVNTTFSGNTVSGNTVGIFEEISYGATISDNKVSGNGLGYHQWLWGAGIAVAASSDVEVYGNHLQGNGNGIVGIQQRRGSGPLGALVVADLKVHGNTVSDSGLSGLGQDYDSKPDIDTRGNSFSGNTYVGGGFQFKSAIDWKTWQSRGMDRGGTWRS